jgi:E3 ubiquitin-protein ligase UBR1/E3 ubiquitin-protein ligase UBR3
MARGDQVYLRPQGDLRLIVAHGNIAVSMLIEKPQLFLRILDVIAKLQVCTGKD